MIEQATLENSAAYIDSWRKHLKDDSRLIVTTASKAQKAADYIQGVMGMVEIEMLKAGYIVAVVLLGV